jgi:WD40 repeat protein/tetratricopeptide (TPR) repeat protein
VAATGFDYPRVWRLDTGAVLAPESTAPITQAPNRIVFSPDEEKLFTVSGVYAGTEVRGWLLPRLQPETRSYAVSQGLRDLVISPDGTTLAVATEGGEVQLRSALTLLPVAPPVPHDSYSRIAFSPDGRFLCTGTDNLARLWDLAVGVPESVRLTTQTVADAAVSADGTRVLLRTFAQPRGRAVQLYDTRTGTAVSGRVDCAEDTTLRLGCSPDCTRFALWYEQPDSTYRIQLWDLREAKPGPVRISVPALYNSGVISPDGGRLAFPTGNTVEIRDTRTGERVAPVLATRATSLAFSPEGDRLALGTNADVRIVDSRSGKEVAGPMPLAQQDPGTLFFSADGRLLVSAGGTGARVWDGLTGRSVSEILPHSLSIGGACLNPDGTVLATFSGGWRKTLSQVHLWDLRTSRPLCSPVPFAGLTLNSLQFRPDGRLLLVSTDECVCCLLDAATGERVSPLLGSRLRGSDSVFRAFFSSDGRQVRAVIGFPPSILSWDLDPLPWDAERLEEMSALLAGQRSGEGGKVDSASPRQQWQDWEKVKGDLPAGWAPGPGEERAWRNYSAAEALGKKQVSLALRHLNALVASSPDDLNLRLRRVEAYRELKRWDEALAELAALLARHPDRPEPWSGRGAVHAAMQHWDRAEADYGEALKRDPSVAKTWRDRGTARAYLERWSDAAADFAEFVQRQTNSVDGWIDRVLAARNAGDEKAARAIIADAWKALGVDHVYWFDGGRILRMALLYPDGKPAPEEVLRTAERLWRLNPQQAEANLRFGAALYRAGQTEKAVRHLESVVKARQGEWTVRAGLFLAMAQHRQGKAEAKKTLEDAVRRMEPFLKVPPANGAAGGPWTWKAEVVQLRAEAEALCRGVPP